VADLATARNLPIGKTQLELQSQDFFYFPHGQLFCWHCFLLSIEKENVPAGCPASLSALQTRDSDISSTYSDAPRKVDSFPPESLDDFDRNHWST